MTPTTTDLKRKTGDGSEAAAAGPLSAEELRKMHAYWRASKSVSSAVRDTGEDHV
jgi:hypothetical protein